MRRQAIRSRSVRSARGLTLIEVLVVLGIVAIVTAIVITTLRGARGRVGQTTIESDARSATQLHAAWRNDHQSRFLNVGEYDEDFVRTGRLADESLIVYLDSLEGRLLQIPYPQQSAPDAWTAVLERWHGEKIRIKTPLMYGFGFFTDPSLWAEGSEPWTQWPAQDKFRFVRESEAAYPASKIILAHLHDESAIASGVVSHPKATAAFVDGSVWSAPTSEFLPQCGGFFGGAPATAAAPGLYTIDGVRGRDATR